jgi:FMN phosphatase YigB (HAD superfamily)
MHAISNHKFILIGLAFLLLHNNALQAATIIFDLGGVLVRHKKMRVSKEIGKKHMFAYLLSFNISPWQMQNTLFDFMASIKPRHPDTPRAMRTGTNLLLPQLMCDWMAGEYRSADVLRMIYNTLNNHTFHFKSRSERKFIQACAHYLFTPEKYARTFTLYKRGAAIAQACANKKNMQGQRAHRLFIVSNWDIDSYQVMRRDKQLTHLFSLFDDIIISGIVGKIKPDKNIFFDLFKKWNIDPNKELCILIDDQPENIESFNTCGTKTRGILCKNFKQVREQLTQLNIL